MIRIIIDNHAHRLLDSGMVESAVVVPRLMANGLPSQTFIIDDDWRILNPEQDLGIHEADFSLVRKYLEVLHAIFPSDRTKVPVAEHTENIALNGSLPKI